MLGIPGALWAFCNSKVEKSLLQARLDFSETSKLPTRLRVAHAQEQLNARVYRDQMKREECQWEDNVYSCARTRSPRDAYYTCCAWPLVELSINFARSYCAASKLCMCATRRSRTAQVGCCKTLETAVRLRDVFFFLVSCICARVLQSSNCMKERVSRAFD